MDEQTKDNIKASFRRYVSDDDGFILLASLREIIRAVWQTADANIDAVLKALYHDKDGKVQYERLIDWLSGEIDLSLNAQAPSLDAVPPSEAFVYDIELPNGFLRTAIDVEFIMKRQPTGYKYRVLNDDGGRPFKLGTKIEVQVRDGAWEPYCIVKKAMRKEEADTEAKATVVASAALAVPAEPSAALAVTAAMENQSRDEITARLRQKLQCASECGDLGESLSAIKCEKGEQRETEIEREMETEMACKPYHPSHVRPEDQFSVMVWVSLAEHIHLADEEMSARQRDFAHEMLPAETGVFKADPNEKFDIELMFPPESLELYPGDGAPSAKSSFVMEESLLFELFECRCKPDATPGMAECEVKVSQSGKCLIRQPFKVCIEPVVDLLQRATTNVTMNHGYDVRGVISQVHTWIRDSIHVYREALRKTRSQDDQALRELLKMQPEDLYAEDEKVDQRSAELMSEVEGLRRNLVRVEPLQSANHKETLIRHAATAQELLKRHIVEGSTQEEAKLWASTRGAGASSALAPYADAAFDPGLKGEEGIERKVQNKYHGAYARLRDVSRLALVFNSPRALLKALGRLRSSSALRLVKVENRFYAPTSLGWMDITCLVELQVEKEMWHVSEIQLQLMEFNEARGGKGGHIFYEHIREVLPKQCKVPIKEMDDVIETILTELTSPPMLS